MSVLSEFEPRRVFHYFEEICAIPHGSGHTDRIREYLCAFAEEHGLKYHADEAGNVIIYKSASAGYEDHPALIIQGHMDMVAVHDAGTDIDMTEHSLELRVDGDRISAVHTSLGGDDGIAIAYALAVLESDELAHPPLEVLITNDEETGMDGARGLDVSFLNGRRLLNIDSEEEGHLLAGCAGGARVYIKKELLWFPLPRLATYRIDITGCTGGHSGSEIHHGRANANMLAGRILYELHRQAEVQLVDIGGGVVDNAIPVSSHLIFAVSDKGFSAVSADQVERMVDEIRRDIKAEYATTDPDMDISFSVCDRENEKGKAIWTTIIDKDDTGYIADLLMSLPNGVMTMSSDVPGLVETSLNLGVLGLDKNALCVQFAVRSSVASAKQALIDKLNAIASLAGADIEIGGDYPGWKYAKESPLREVMSTTYARMYGHEPVVEAIHAGLECGFFADKIPGLDCVSIGPDMSDVHTTSESLSIASTARTWDYLCEVLKDL